MFSLLVSTVGVSMHAVYCYCVGETTLQLLVAEDPCETEKKEESPKDCCRNVAPVEQEEPSCCQKLDKPDGCMKTTTTVFVMKADLDLAKITLKTFDVQDVISPLPFVYVPVFSVDHAGMVLLNKAPPEPPPALSGRDICLRAAVFLC